MTPAELTRARAVLGLSAERLAVDLHLSEETVVQWEAGKARIPNVYARQIAWRAALTERQRALAGSGLRECDWVARWKNGGGTQEAGGSPQAIESVPGA